MLGVAGPLSVEASGDATSTDAPGSGSSVAADAGLAPDFARDILPILRDSCFECHGSSRPRARLRLDARANAMRGGVSGPAIVPGDPEASLLLQRVRGLGDDEAMPPGDRPKLSPERIELLRRWIAAGAPWPEDAPGEAAEAHVETHWAFVPPARPEPPAVRDESAIREPLDRFVQARLEREGIAPSPEADRPTLIRRVSLDLTGLPPTPEEVDAFASDPAPDAYERLVDRLLASPAYGERWARWWLDQARYADSNGYSIDGPREIWKYRDWVIDALNRDLPFDRFGTEQLAGDLLPDATTEQKIATGFHRNTMINQEGGVDPEEFRVEAVHDRTRTTAEVFLGVTLGCAQCHNHKYDPFPQKDYYRFFAFFDSDDEPTLEVGSPEETARRDAVRAQTRALEEERREYRDELRKTLAEREAAWVAELSAEARAKLDEKTRAALETPAEARSSEQGRLVETVLLNQDPGWVARGEAIDAVKARAPKLPTTLVLRRREEPRETRLLLAGDFTRPGEVVRPGTPVAIPPFAPAGEDAPDAPLRTRLDLARWLFDPANPLTARVLVNRLWQEHFGRGIVETSNDFGAQASPPSNPELLDWLATGLVADGWSMKATHRRMVLSAAYRRTSNARPDLADVDPQNLLLARRGRLRLEAESIRDSALSVSGLLSRKLGGPSVFPPIPEGATKLGQVAREWKVSEGEDRYRRALYTFHWRATPHPSMTVFDAPDGNVTCTRRERSNTPLQALTLLNDEAFHECATALASRVEKEIPAAADPLATDAARARRAFRLALAREPEADELGVLVRLADEERRALAGRGDAPPAAAGSAKAPGDRALVAVARALLNLDEFVTRE